MTTFERRHMAAIADVLKRAALRPNDSAAECLSDLREDFADLMARHNSEFKRAKFFAACSPNHGAAQ